MRGPLALGLLAALLLPLVPLSHAQSTANCGASQFAAVGADAFWCDNFSGSQATDWTPTASTTTPPGMAWRKDTAGNQDSVAWFAGVDSAAGKGYLSASSVTLTSPAIPMQGKLPTRVSVDVAGEAEPTFDFVHLEISRDGGAWTRLLSSDGPGGAGFVTLAFTDAAALVGFTGTIRLRALFVSDSSCDTFDSEAVPLCTGSGWPGIRIDNVVLAARDPPAPPPPTAPQQGNRLPRLANLQQSVPELDTSAFGSAVRFSLDATDDRGVAHAEAYLQRGFDLIKVPLQRGDGARWSGTLQASDERLTTGTWNVTYAAYDTDGAANSTRSGTLVVKASEPGPAPKVTLLGRDAIKHQTLGPNDVLRFDVNSTVLRSVTYQLRTPDGVGPRVALGYPYVLGAGALAEGAQTVEVVATDRLNRTNTPLLVQATLDTLPPQATIVPPKAAHAGVPLQVSVLVREASPYVAVVSAAGTLATFNGTGTQTHTFTVTPPAPGQLAIGVSVQDAVGQHASSAIVVPVLNLTTDAHVVQVRALSDDLVSGSAARVRVEVRQVDGLASIPFTVRLEGGPRHLEQEVILPATGAADLEFQVLGLAPGRHSLVATITGPTAVVESNPANNQAVGEVEVFLGRVSEDGKVYRIRAGPEGHPASAVDAAGKEYPLTLDQESGATVYRFQAADGNLTWDPLSPTSKPAVPEGDPAGEQAPGLGAVAALAALAFVARRRRA